MSLTTKLNEFRMRARLMGSAFELIVVEQHATKAKEILSAGVSEIERIEALLTEFSDTSATSDINRKAGVEPVEISQEVFSLLERCQQISRLTQGAFDITVSPLKQIYSFKKKDFSMPSADSICKALDKVGYQQLILDRTKSSAYLTRRGMRISFAAIGKGYAADCVKKLWLRMGVQSGVINASGDLTVFGKSADGKPWKLGIPEPDDRQSLKFSLPLTDSCVATSGDYEQYFIHDGIRYSHSIHPLTGYPVQGIKSVSIFSPGAELSDALATAVFVMGVENGLHLIDQLPATHCIIVDGFDRTYFSKGVVVENEKSVHEDSYGEVTREEVTRRVMDLLKAVVIMLLLISLNACAAVSPYQRIYLNDPEMQMGGNAATFFEHYILTIREGAMPAGGTKSSGGCGCN